MHEDVKPPFLFLRQNLYRASEFLSAPIPLPLFASVRNSHLKARLTSLPLNLPANSLWVQFHNPLPSLTGSLIHQISFRNILSRHSQLLSLLAIILRRSLKKSLRVLICLFSSLKNTSPVLHSKAGAGI